MKAIMISMKPKYCASIMNGDKTIEVRKNKALAIAIQKLIDKNGYADIYVYCTKEEGIARIGRLGEVDKFVCKIYPLNEVQYKSMHRSYSAKGKVIFKFRCYKVEEIPSRQFSVYTYPYTETLDDYELLGKSCLFTDKLDNYLGYDKKGYAIHISNLEIFRYPREIYEFHKNIKTEPPKELLCPECGKPMEYYEYRYLTKAPQNFCYIEEE